ncbi:hypothetical protein K457DRAFT_13411 [Linnemannia elongata AG-77]|uniref:Transmembrane protein n=1 Tax=Linnemannia elongata AG-77 TaxID=1314771 RepID=A0A197KEA0_9FUNG|nr:hypothetical protein K457DRAFT_13411 [Linnemannia elongata AG-77]
MIFSVPFWVSSLAITLIKIILSGTIGAVLTFYVRYSSDQYANSIRWSRIGGLYETTTLLKNSLQKLPQRSSIIMAVMIIANVLTLFVTISLGAFVSRTDMASDPTSAVVITGRLPPANSLTWTDWSSLMQADAGMEDTLVQLLNNTRINPNPLPKTDYAPRKYDYEIPCEETGVLLSDGSENSSLLYPSLHDNCKVMLVTLLNGTFYSWDAKNATNRKISEGVHMVTAPFSYHSELHGKIMELTPTVEAFNGRMCSGDDPDLAILHSFPKNGMTSLPQTYATRCQYDTDDSFIMTATYIKFAVNRLNDFDKVTTSIMNDASSLPLLQSMYAAINNGTFLTTTDNSTLVILTSLSTNIDVLMCVSMFSNTPSTTSTVGLLCSYFHVTTIATKPQPWDPIPPKIFNQLYTPFFNKNFNATNRNEIVIYHMPLGLNDSMDTYSAPHLLKATADATVYLASLGHNVFMNTQTEQLYVLYDTVTFKDAFETPDYLLIFLLVASLVCIVVWASSEKFTPVFNGSMYKVIYEEIKSKDDKTQMLMDCTHNPLAFEGYQAISDLDEQVRRSSQEYDMTVLENRSTEQPPPQQIPTQQASTLQDIPTLSPFMPSASSFASAATTTPASLVFPALPASPVAPVDPVAFASTAASSYHTETTLLSSQPVNPIYSPPIPPRPQAHDGTRTCASSTQVLPPLHTATNHVSQETPSSPPSLPSTQTSTRIQSPFL